MLKNIQLIASIISALTAVTTSLRALGKSREYLRYELEAKIKTSCRVGDHAVQHTKRKNNSIFVHLIVTIIWFVLSVIFALLFFDESGSSGTTAMFQYLLPLLLLLVLLGFIWWKVLYPKG